MRIYVDEDCFNFFKSFFLKASLWKISYFPDTLMSCFVTLQPLMVRFQAAYKAHLLKQQEKVHLELRELVSVFVNTENTGSSIDMKWSVSNSPEMRCIPEFVYMCTFQDARHRGASHIKKSVKQTCQVHWQRIEGISSKSILV